MDEKEIERLKLLNEIYMNENEVLKSEYRLLKEEYNNKMSFTERVLRKGYRKVRSVFKRG